MVNSWVIWFKNIDGTSRVTSFQRILLYLSTYLLSMKVWLYINNNVA